MRYHDDVVTTHRLLLLCGVLTLLPVAVQAQLVTDAGAPANQRATLLSSGNGIPLANIQTPSPAGVSRNAWSRFDVQSQGAILNNARVNTVSQLGGWVQGNPWLVGGTARVILNEVNSSNPSLLKGYVEIAGDRAQLIIANPAGITCDGCGFLNANRATLTTGTPLLNGGNLEGYLVQRGNVVIEGAGLDASQVDYTDLIARAIQVNAGLWARQLTAVTGANRVDAASSQAITASGVGAVPAYALDVAQLGGMYAGKITLVGTEAGLGARNAGNLGASAGEAVVTLDGRLENMGNINASGNLRIDAQGGIANSGILYAKGNSTLDTRIDIVNTGANASIGAQGNTTLTARGIDNAGALGAGIGSDGRIGSDGDLDLSAATVDNRGGQIKAGGDIGIHLGDGELDNTASLIRAGRTLTIHAGRVGNAGSQGNDQGMAGHMVNLSTRQIDNRNGALFAEVDLVLSGTAGIDNRGGLISSGETVSLRDPGSADKTLAIDNGGGTLIAGTRLSIDSASLTGDGDLLSHGDLTLRLTQDYFHSGRLQGDANASLVTTGSFVNQSTLLAGAGLSLKAASIDNQATGRISGNQVKLEATDSHTLTNRGLIDGQDTVIETPTLNNLGSGRIYGDHVAIAVTTLNNDSESGVAPVIAARARLDIGAQTIRNREHAMLFSGGDMVVGGGLDASKQAGGQASRLDNASATIEALGNLTLSVVDITNTNEHFSTETVEVSRQVLREYQIVGRPERWAPDQVYTYDGEELILHVIPTGQESVWVGFNRYDFTRSTRETTVIDTDPGHILAGGDMQLFAENLFNDRSRIIAGGALTGSLGSLTNSEVAGEREISDVGSVTNYFRIYRKGRDTYGTSTAAYMPASRVQAINLTPTVYRQYTTPTGTATQIPAQPAHAGIQQIASLSAPGSFIRTTTPVGQTSDSRLYRQAPDPAAHYFIESDPQFTNYRAWLSSDSLLASLGHDPATMLKRLGDGYLEQNLIREQVALLTGRRFLDGYVSDEAQYAALINNAVTYARQVNLQPGIALTAAQMANLTSDIVWLVEQEVNLANGGLTRVLVPQLYVRVRDADLQASGALLAGNDVYLGIGGDLVNSGHIAGYGQLAINAGAIGNLGGRIKGNDLNLQALGDFVDIGGYLEGRNSLRAVAGRDLLLASSSRVQGNAQGSRTNIDRIATVYAGSGGLQFGAGRDLDLNALQATSAGGATLSAGRDLSLGVVSESVSNHVVWNAANQRSDSTSADMGSSLTTAGDLTLLAGQDLTSHAASLNSEQGALIAAAGNDVTLANGKTTQSVDETHQHKSKGFLSSKTTTTHDRLEQSTSQATTFSGVNVVLQAGHDLVLQGSYVVADLAATLIAQHDLRVEAATNSTLESHLKDIRQSGFLGGGGGITIGTRQQSIDQQTRASQASASTVGSIHGDIAIQAGAGYRQTGSDILAPQGDIIIAAPQILIEEARETTRTVTETRLKQSGLNIGLHSPVISAGQTIYRMSEAAANTDAPRMRALAVASGALAAMDAAAAVKAGQAVKNGNLADKVGGINLSLSLGTSQSQSTTLETSESARGSSTMAGGDTEMHAHGAGNDGTLTVQGSRVQTGHDLTLRADGDIQFLAARNTVSQTSSNKSSGASVGLSVGTGGLQFTAGASSGQGSSNSSDLLWSNVHLEAGNLLTLESGGNATLKGLVARAEQIAASFAGDLALESLQDRSVYSSQQQSQGITVSLGSGGMGGSLSASRSGANSVYSSVLEQTGLIAGDGGFQIEVQGHTGLIGAIVASTPRAVEDGSNRFITSTLITADIQNRANATAESSGLALDGGLFSQGKYGIAKALSGNGLNAADITSAAVGRTRAAISEGVVAITGDQFSHSGSDAGQTIATLYRDTASAHTTAQKQDIERMKQTVEAEQSIKAAAFKEAAKFTDEAYRVSFLEQARMYRVERNPKTGEVLLDKDRKPVMTELTPAEKTALKPEAGSKLNVFTNGIFNDKIAAGKYAVQMSEAPPGQEVYLVYFPSASNGISELMVAGYQKFMEGSIGDLANATQEVTRLMTQYGVDGLNLVGHSRGAMTIGNALETLARDPGAGGILSGTELKFVGPAYSAQAAANLLHSLSYGKQSLVKLQNHADDFIGTLVGGNPATYDLLPSDSNRINEWIRIFGDAPTVHSCYGTGAVDTEGCHKAYGNPITINAISNQTR